MYGKIIKHRRESLNMSQLRLSLDLNNDNAEISRWENEKVKPSYKTAEKLAKILGGEPKEYRE
jgi:ribosome-binding protein aMBF1 (putative translation factor)